VSIRGIPEAGFTPAIKAYQLIAYRGVKKFQCNHLIDADGKADRDADGGAMIMSKARIFDRKTANMNITQRPPRLSQPMPTQPSFRPVTIVHLFYSFNCPLLSSIVSPRLQLLNSTCRGGSKGVVKMTPPPYNSVCLSSMLTSRTR